MERMRTVRARVAEHDDPERFRKMGVDVVFGSARLEAPDRVSVDGRVLQSPRIVIATGALPSAPPIEGLEAAGFLTHVSAFDQDELPARMAMVGGGPIGLEFAQIYSRLGAAVTVVEALPTLLPQEDPDAGRLMAELLEAEGIAVRVGQVVERVTRGADGTKALHFRDADGGARTAAHVLEVDEIFVATGRRANTDGLGLEEIGVRLDRGGGGGAVKVDAALRSNVKGIWAAGDVTGGLQFTHVAEYQSKLVLRNAIFPFPRKANYAMVPWVTYTDPEVARVGLTELEAQERFDGVKTYRYEFADLDRAIVDGHTEGFIKIVTRKNGRIVGATVLASGAGDLILPVVMAMNGRMKISQLSHIVYPYPTMVEGVKRTADSYYREQFVGRTGEWLRKVVRWLK